jgi:hypothetical protein
MDMIFVLGKSEYPEQFEFAVNNGLYEKFANDEQTAIYLSGTQRYILLRDCPIKQELLKKGG